MHLDELYILSQVWYLQSREYKKHKRNSRLIMIWTLPCRGITFVYKVKLFDLVTRIGRNECMHSSIQIYIFCMRRFYSLERSLITNSRIQLLVWLLTLFSIIKNHTLLYYCAHAIIVVGRMLFTFNFGLWWIFRILM